MKILKIHTKIKAKKFKTEKKKFLTIFHVFKKKLLFRDCNDVAMSCKENENS
jgi:hypothetical protein